MSKLDQSKTPLFSVLKNEYVGRDILPFHIIALCYKYIK